jgi:hypothetical protein
LKWSFISIMTLYVCDDVCEIAGSNSCRFGFRCVD